VSWRLAGAALLALVLLASWRVARIESRPAPAVAPTAPPPRVPTSVARLTPGLAGPAATQEPIDDEVADPGDIQLAPGETLSDEPLVPPVGEIRGIELAPGETLSDELLVPPVGEIRGIELAPGETLSDEPLVPPVGEMP
jgi:hypothetical protein